jgi:hypothetical protein
MQSLPKLAPTKMFMSGREGGLISQINLRAPFGGDLNILEYALIESIHAYEINLFCLAV